MVIGFAVALVPAEPYRHALDKSEVSEYQIDYEELTIIDFN